MYGNPVNTHDALLKQATLLKRLDKSLLRLKAYNSTPETESLLKRHLEASEYISKINSSAFLLCNNFYSVSHILKLRDQKWNGIY